MAMTPLITAVRKEGKGTLSSYLVNYRDTPHSATVASPMQMIFRDGYRSNLSHKSLSDHEINTARLRD